MDTPPLHSPGGTEFEQHRAELDALDVATLAAAPSWGERMLPYLFAAMETCWVDAILIGLASTGFSQAHTLFMPLWVPFVLIASAYWLTVHLERRSVAAGAATEGHATTTSPGFLSVVGLIVLVTLFIVWSSVYSSTIALYDLKWLSLLFSDTLSLAPNALHILAIIALSLYFCWRGLRLSRSTLEPSSVFAVLRLGVGIFILVILFQAANGTASSNEIPLLLLIPLFLAFALTAHSFAQATFVRRFHTVGLQGSVAAQERSLFGIIGAMGVLLLLVSLLIGSFASPAFLGAVQRIFEPVAVIYDWLARAIAYIAVLLATPIFWLLQGLHFRLQPPRIGIPQPTSCVRVRNSLVCSKPKPPAPDPTIAAIVLAIKLLLPILAIILLVVLIRLALRRRRVRMVRREDDEHESLWSWELFLMQLRTFLQALWLRFFPRRAVEGEHQENEEDIATTPTARSIREVYRAMLRWAAGRGYPRKKSETPYEFRSRLDERMPLAEPELSTVTEAYTATRYGGALPGEDEVARVRQAWTQLQQKPQNNSQ